MQVVGTSQHTVCHILKNELHMTKVSAQWVPGLLTLEQKRLCLSLKQHKSFCRQDSHLRLCRRFSKRFGRLCTEK